VIATTLLFAACSTTNKTEAPDDATIKDSVQAKLFQDTTLKMRDVHVDSQKGVVTLTGTVGSDMEKLAVEGLARGTPGVGQVINQLTVSEGLATQTPAAVEPAASKPAPERPRKSKDTRRAMASVETPAAVETLPPEPAPQSAAPAPKPAEAQVVRTQPAPAPQPPPPPPPIEVTVPAGTVITIRMIDGIDSARNRAGEELAASLEAPIVVGDKVVIQRGADARVRLVQVTSAGHVEGRSEVKLELASINANGRTYNLQTGYYDKQGASRGKRTAETLGGASGLGALIGAIAGGGKGAAIGAGVGAAGGGVATGATQGEQVKIPPETKLDFTLKSPFTVTLNRTETSAVSRGTVVREHPDFSGTWVLDRDRTPNLPSSLQSYTLVARQSGQVITLQTRLQGNFRSGQGGISGGQGPGGGGYPGGGGIGFPGGGLGGIGGGMGGMGRGRRGGMGGMRNGSRNEMTALQMTVPDGTYNLNGEETAVDLAGRTSGKATVSANWVEGGKAIQLSVDRRIEMQGNEVDISSNEHWKLPDDGQTLVVDRSVNTPRGSESVKLTFRKSTETAQNQP
jgi:hypothetical protein